MGVGQFRHKAEFQTREDVVDSLGQPSQTYTTVRTEGVQISQLSGNERQRFTQGVATDDEFISLTARFSEALDAVPNSARIVIKGKNYEIAGKSLIDFRQQYMRFVIRGVR